jgi:branched-chain amino acid transport system substrate-binding protein
MRPLLIVGLIAGFTSSDPNTANEFKRGMEVFMKLHPEISKQLEIRVTDNRGDAAYTLELMRKMAKEDGVRVFIGVSNSDEAITASIAAEETRSLFITPFATNPKVTQNKKYTFRACYSDEIQGRTLAKFAGEELRPKSVHVLTNRDSHYSQGLSESFLKRLKSTHPKIRTEQILYSKNDYRWPEIQAQLEKNPPEVVFIPDHVTHAGVLTKHINEAFPGRVFLGGDGWGGKRVLHAIHGENHPSRAFYSTHWDEAMAGPEAARFNETYHAMFPQAESISSRLSRPGEGPRALARDQERPSAEQADRSDRASSNQRHRRGNRLPTGPGPHALAAGRNDRR